MAHDALPEPKSPMWLPALGAALLVLAAIVWAVTPPFERADVSPDAGVDSSATMALGDASADGSAVPAPPTTPPPMPRLGRDLPSH